MIIRALQIIASSSNYVILVKSPAVTLCYLQYRLCILVCILPPVAGTSFFFYVDPVHCRIAGVSTSQIAASF